MSGKVGFENPIVDPLKHQVGAEVSRFKVSSLGFFFRSQQLTYKIVYTWIDVISSEEDTMENTKHLRTQIAVGILIKKFLFSVLRHAATGGKFSGEQ